MYYTDEECERSESRSHFIGRWDIINRLKIVLNRTVVVDSD